MCLDANTEAPKRHPYQNSGMWMQVSSLPINPPLQNTPRYQFSLKSESIDKMATIANQRLISICNIIIYLEIKFLPIRRIFVFWRPFCIQNGRHSKPTMDINLQHHYLLGSQNSSQSEDFVFWRPFWIHNGRHSKPTMDINLQHHYLLGNQISSKSEDFCILGAILDSKWRL